MGLNEKLESLRAKWVRIGSEYNGNSVAIEFDERGFPAVKVRIFDEAHDPTQQVVNLVMDGLRKEYPEAQFVLSEHHRTRDI